MICGLEVLDQCHAMNSKLSALWWRGLDTTIDKSKEEI